MIVTASTDELSQLGSCFLQLKLVIDRGDKKENVLMGALTSFSFSSMCVIELSLPQFYQFLAEMQSAKRQCAAVLAT
jgi:hypothetical protein